LLIRTGGEQRISNFLLWNAAYAELFFTDRLWPEFDVKELEAAFTYFASRQRRFGQTGEQVESASPEPASGSGAASASGNRS
jgi:undecaprenyl diphosphate synthase